MKKFWQRLLAGGLCAAMFVASAPMTMAKRADTAEVLFTPEFVRVTEFSGGIAYANTVDMALYQLDLSGGRKKIADRLELSDQWSYETGPHITDKGYTAVKNPSGDGVWLISGESYGKTTPPQFDAYRDMGGMLAGLTVGTDGFTASYTLLTETGEIIRKTGYSYVDDFVNGYAAVSLPKEGSYLPVYGLIDATGKEVIQPQYGWIGRYSNGMIAFRDRSENQQRAGFLDLSGKEVLPKRYAFTGDFSEGLAVVRTMDGNGTLKSGYIDTAGKEIIPPQYVNAGDFLNGYAVVQDSRGQFLITPDGKEAGGQRYDWIDAEGDSKLGIRYDADDPQTAQYTILGESGEETYTFTANAASYMGNGLYVVWKKDGGKTVVGAINLTGKEVIPFQYADARLVYDSPVLPIQNTDGKWGYRSIRMLEDAYTWVLKDGVYYCYQYGEMIKSQWVRDKGKRYYLDDAGKMLTGWQQLDGSWYLFAGSGAMQTGWAKAGGRWYYFGDSGIMRTGWFFVHDRWYYADASGKMQTGWQLVGNKWYYLGADGGMRTGWYQVNKRWYFSESSGAMRTGWQQIGGKWYLLASSGEMKTAWQFVGNKWYYFGADGGMRTGWYQVNNWWYFSESSGAMRTGWQRIGGKWYLLASSGEMKTGWQKVRTQWYFLESSGHMLESTSRWIGGKLYRFSASGVCLNP